MEAIAIVKINRNILLIPNLDFRGLSGTLSNVKKVCFIRNESIELPKLKQMNSISKKFSKNLLSKF